MYCNNCGTQMADGAKFCPKCGMKMDIQNPANQNPVNQSMGSPIRQLVPAFAGVLLYFVVSR